MTKIQIKTEKNLRRVTNHPAQSNVAKQQPVHSGTNERDSKRK